LPQHGGGAAEDSVPFGIGGDACAFGVGGARLLVGDAVQGVGGVRGFVADVVAVDAEDRQAGEALA
jgi:hypothetical protein